MTPTDEYVLVDDGVRLFVQTIGEGPTAVLIPNGLYLFDALERLADRRRLIFVDPRNRGRSDAISDRAKIERGVHHDVDDLDAIRRHFGLARVDLIGHSYMGVTVVLYAIAHPAQAGRVVQIGAMPPDSAREYPAHLTNLDATRADVLGRLAALQRERDQHDPEAFCRAFWSILRALYVTDPADADRLKWEPCHLPNERSFVKQYTEYLLPSIQQLDLSAERLASVRTPVLAIHGRNDRSSPYGGGRDWVRRLPQARLVTMERSAHAPWIEEPERFHAALEAFLQGTWPETSESVGAVE
jgi:proline iminopeptidase